MEGRRGDEGREKEGKGIDGRRERSQDPAGFLHSPVLYTCSSSTIPSLPPPNTTMSSLMATARWP